LTLWKRTLASSRSKTGRPRPRIGSPGGISYRRPWPTLGCRAKYDDDVICKLDVPVKQQNIPIVLA